MEVLQAFLSVSSELEVITSMRRRRRSPQVKAVETWAPGLEGLIFGKTFLALRPCEIRGNLGTAGCYPY